MIAAMPQTFIAACFQEIFGLSKSDSTQEHSQYNPNNNKTITINIETTNTNKLMKTKQKEYM